MSEDRRPALIAAAFEAFETNDVAGLVDFLHPEVESRVAPPLLNAGTWHGQAGFAQMVAGWGEVWDEMHYEMLDTELLDDRNVFVSVHQEAKGIGSGVPVELDVVYLVEFEGERAVRFEVHATRESALAAV